MRPAAALLLLVLLAAGCAARPLPQPPAPRHFPAAGRTLYFPLVTAAPRKLGVAGCAADMSALGNRWCYSWTADPRCAGPYERVPMLWDETHVADAIGGCSEWVMGFNEPDHPGQANLTPEQAVAPWAAVEQTAGGWQLVAPAPAYSTRWLTQFRAAFQAAYGRAPRFDALAVHCYAGNARACIDKVQTFEELARAWGAPGAPLEVWVTEFYFADEREARAFVAYLEADDMVTRYAPFVSRLDCADAKEYGYWDCDKAGDPSLLNTTAGLTRYGAWYAQPTPEGP